MFNTTEMNLMILYNPGTRLGLMEELGNMLGYLSGEETGCAARRWASSASSRP